MASSWLLRGWASRVAILALAFSQADAQTCPADGCKGNLHSVDVPYGEAALWAAAKVPPSCDTHNKGQQCNWAAAADAWRYAFNNLRLALEGAAEEQLGESGLARNPVLQQAKDLQAVVGKLGQDAKLWGGSWPQAAGGARELMEQLRPWLGKANGTAVSLPRSGIATRFPALGRSVAVATDGNMAAMVSLANGYPMPVLGFGVWQIPADGSTYRSVKWALELGYRHIDTAQAYGNEQEVGRAIRDSGLRRSEICLVTKLSNPTEYVKARQRFEQQLTLMGLDYVDVYMLHSPGKSAADRRQAWQQLEALYDEGKIKALGVSNFGVGLLQELLAFARVRPVYIQNKYSIYQPGGRDEALAGASLMEWLAREQVAMTGYSTIHPGHGGYLSPLEDPHVKAIAARHGRTASQVLHRWLLQLGAAVIPRSTKHERIRENGDLFSFMLPETDMRLLNGVVSLLKSLPGAKAPAWCEDVFGLQAL